MKLVSLHYERFRNLAALTLEPSPHATIAVGENGQGKTNLLEGLYLLATLKPLRASIEGLHHECRTAAAPAQMHHWVELIQSYVMRFAQPLRSDDRLWQLWEQVGRQPERKWTLPALATASHLSAEHLRRLSKQQLGRSPMQQVTYLRMQRAGELLSTTEDKIEAIATAVGYENPFVFSTTFKKWIGWRPSEFRTQQARPRHSAGLLAGR